MIMIWNQLSFDTRYSLWLGFGVGLLACVLVIWYYWMRHLLGHRKFHGVWYNSYEFKVLVDILRQDRDSGHRVLRNDELALLREIAINSIKRSCG